jgi:hypothetical protein
VGLRALKSYKPLANCTLEEINGEKMADFAAHRQIKGLQVTNLAFRIAKDQYLFVSLLHG